MIFIFLLTSPLGCTNSSVNKPPESIEEISETGVIFESTSHPSINIHSPDETPETGDSTQLPVYAPGYNCYGIPSSYMWRLYDENGVLNDNVDEIVIDIKNEFNIPHCITGIPFDDRAKELLINSNGDLADNGEEIIEQLKSEWLVNKDDW